MGVLVLSLFAMQIRQRHDHRHTRHRRMYTIDCTVSDG